MDDIKTTDELQQLLNQAEADKAELQSQLDDALAVNAALVAEFDKVPAQPAPTVKAADFKTLFFEYEGGKKGFNYSSIYHKNKKISAEQISLSEDLQRELIAMNSGMIKHF